MSNPAKNKEINLDKNPLIRPVLDYIFAQFEKKEIANLSNIDKFKMIKDIFFILNPV